MQERANLYPIRQRIANSPSSSEGVSKTFEQPFTVNTAVGRKACTDITPKWSVRPLVAELQGCAAIVQPGCCQLPGIEIWK